MSRRGLVRCLVRVGRRDLVDELGRTLVTRCVIDHFSLLVLLFSPLLVFYLTIFN